MKTTTVVFAILLIIVLVEAKKGKDSKEKGPDPKDDKKSGEKDLGSKEKSGEKDTGSKEISGEIDTGSKEKSGEKHPKSKEKSGEKDSGENKSLSKSKSGENHSGENVNIQLTIQIDSNKYLYSSGSNTYIIYDIQNRLYLMFNGKTHVIIIINLNYDYEIMTLVYLDQKASRAVWKSDSFDDFLNDALDFSAVYHVSQRYGLQFFELQTVTKEVIQSIREILVTFGSGYSSTSCQTAISVIQVAVRTSFFVGKSLNGVERITGSGNSVQVQVNRDYQWWNGFWGGFATFSTWSGGVKNLESKGVQIDLQKVATQQSGIHSLGLLLGAVAGKLDVEEVFYKNINSEFYFFTLATKLGGRDDREFNGLLKVVTSIVGYNYDRVSEQTLRFYWRQFFRNKRGNFKNLDQEWEVSIQFIVGVFEEYKLQDSLSNIYQVLVSIQKNEWKEQTVNMTEVMAFLFKTCNKAPNVTDKDFDDFLKLINRA